MAKRGIIQRIYIVAALCIMFAANGAFVPAWASIQTPPELRDFRLDEKPAERKDPVPAGPEITASPAPASTPQTQPQRVDPPSVRSTVSPPPTITAVQPTQKQTTAPGRVSERSQPSPSTSVAAAADENEASSTRADALEITAPTLVVDDPIVTEPTKTVDTVASDTLSLANLPWLAIAVILGLASVFLLIFAAVKRHRQMQSVDDDIVAPVPVISPEQSYVPDTANVTLPLPPVAAAPLAVKNAVKKKVEPAVQNHPDLTLSFIPNKATISFTTLTIKGDLRIINEGKAEARAMRLRAALISASEQHIDIIDGFHTFAGGGEGEDIGDAKPGERIGMEIELMIPLVELKTYPFNDWQLFVPIFLGNMTYNSPHDDNVRQARITCMIGREATPPAPKMGPFRLDLGPRSFAVLGQRPIAA